MKTFFTVLTALFAIFTVNAQNLNDLAVEKQYPDDAKALEVYQAAVDRQADPGTPASKVTWLANKSANNWFVSLAGGVAWLGSENFRDIDLKDNLKFTGAFAFGRWFSPVFGARLGITGAKLSTIMGPNNIYYIGQNHPNPQGYDSPQSYVTDNGSDPQYFKNLYYNDGKPYKGGYLCDFTHVAASVDLLINLKNLFMTYNPDAFFNPVLYGGIGYSHTLQEKERTSVNLIMERFGLQFNFRVAKQVDLYLAAETMLAPEMFDRMVGGNREQDQVISAKLGLTYHFGFKNFIKAPLGVQTVQAAPDQSQINTLNDRINDLKQRLNDCLSKPAPVPATPEVKTAGLEPVFFNLDKYDIRDNSEMVKIEKAAQYLKDNKEALLVLAGYADVKTGSHSHNLTLSKNRVNTVADVLIKKYGINKNRLILAPGGDKTQPFSVNEKNRAVLFLK